MTNTFAFIQAIKGQATKDMNKYGILASLTIAQAILESGWGSSGLSKSANNLFGIKAFSSWKGAKVNLPTHEYYHGKRIEINSYFRKYKSWGNSITDHTKLLMTKRYERIIGVTDYKLVCKLIRDCGYATDISYTTKLINIIETYKLYEYDTINKIEKVVNSMDIKVLQRWLNLNGFRDVNGDYLQEDGMIGEKTIYAKEKVKEMLNYIMK